MSTSSNRSHHDGARKIPGQSGSGYKTIPCRHWVTKVKKGYSIFTQTSLALRQYRSLFIIEFEVETVSRLCVESESCVTVTGQ